MNITHFTLHTAQCILHTLHSTLHTANWILHTSHCTLHTAQYILGKVKKKMNLWPRSNRRGGGVSGLVVVVLRVFFFMLQTYLCGLRKPQNIFCVHSKLHTLSKLFESVDLTFHLIFVKIYLTVSLCFYGFHGQYKPKFLQNMFHTILNNSIYET